MRHGRLPLVWGGNGRGDRKGGERVIGGEWVYRIGITLSENYPDGVEISLSAYNLVLVHLLPSNKRCVFPSLIPVKFLSIGMIYADN